MYKYISGADPGFQAKGAHLKKLRRAEGGAKNFGVFRVKNYDFTPKNLIFSNFRGGGGARPEAPPLGTPPRPPENWKNMIVGRKIVIFPTKYPKNVRAPPPPGHFFLRAPPPPPLT